MNKEPLLICLIMLSVFTGCKIKTKKPIVLHAENMERTRDFPVVQTPGVITEPLERINYMAEHLWDNFIDTSSIWLNDSTHIKGVELQKIEEQMGIYATLLESVSLEHAKSSISAFFNKIEENNRIDTSSNILNAISMIVAKYFYDPNSPLRNEDIYLPYIQKLASSELTPESMRQAYLYDAKMCALNQVGSKSANFEFTTLENKIYSLYGIKSLYTILFFSNPGCQACKEIIEVFTSNPKIADLLKGGILSVVNIYIDRDIDEWLAYADIYPKEWYNGYDHKYIIRTDRIYNVRAIPSLYLLDKDKKVIMKDAIPENIFVWLDNIHCRTLHADGADGTGD
ncbi:MAG: DUF5106 domain-containing protein [Candidatus Cryptobacteroides sp.]